MRILIVSYHFPPFNCIAAVRVGKMAKYLEQQGNDVRVLSCRDQPLDNSLEVELVDSQVLYSKWVDVNFLPMFLLGGKEKVLQEGGASIVTKKGKILQFFVNSYKNILNFPDREIGWYPFAIRMGEGILKEWQADIIYASAPPFTSLLVAKHLAQRFNIPWVAEFRDLWSDNQNRKLPVWRKKLEQKLENKILKSVSGLVTVSAPLSDTLQSHYSKPVRVIENGFDPDDYQKTLTAPSSAQSMLTLVYTGMIYPGKQDPGPLFEALSALELTSKDIKVIFYGRNHINLKQLVEQYNVSHLVEIRGLVSFKESIQAQIQADAVLFLQWNDPEQKGVLTGKFFEYLGARRPILSIGYEFNIAADMIRERHAGVVLNDSKKISQQLMKWLQVKKEKGHLPQLASSIGDGFSRKELAGQLMSFFDELLAHDKNG